MREGVRVNNGPKIRNQGTRCQHCSVSAWGRTTVSRSWLRDRGVRHLHFQFLAERNEARVIPIIQNEGCAYQLRQTEIVPGISAFEPFKHIVGFFAQTVDSE